MWYEGQLRLLQAVSGVEIDFYNRRYEAYDVILFMGYDPKCREAKSINPKAKVGVIDIRPAAKQETDGADFIIANGIEMYDWYTKVTGHIFLYPPYPILPYWGRQTKTDRDPIVLAYHGNKVHLQGMYPRITCAVEMLARERKIEFRALYNIRNLGKWKLGVPNHPNVTVRHIQWKEDAFEELLTGADIGIVPNFIPLYRRPWGDSKSVSPRTFNDDSTDYLTRYKATSNAGRIFVFAQQGIPVVSDMFPSALQLIDNGVDGLLCYSTAAWYRALYSLSSNADLASTLGEQLRKKYKTQWSAEVLNKQLVAFIASVPKDNRTHVFENNNYFDRPGGLSYYMNTRLAEFRSRYDKLAAAIRRRLRRRDFVG